MKTKKGVKMPRRACEGDAGYDFFAPKDIELKAGEWVEFGTGVFLDGTEAPVTSFTRHNAATGFDETFELRMENWMLLLLPRSGLGFKHAIRLSNTAGVVDERYRDEIRCRMTADEDVVIPKGKAYMQGIFVPFLTMSCEVKPEKVRKGGFGSTDGGAE